MSTITTSHRGTGTSPDSQHMQALQRANEVRLARADLKKRIARGEQTVPEVVLDTPWEAESMTLFELLTSQRRWGNHRAQRFLAGIGMPETKTLQSMTERQRALLARMIAPS